MVKNNYSMMENLNVHTKMKKLLIAMFALLLVTPLALASFSVTIDDVATGPLSVVAGQKLPIEVVFDMSRNFSDVKVEVELSYNGKDVEVESEAIDLISGTIYKRNLMLTVPSNIDTTPEGESYTISIRLKDGKGKTLASSDFELTVQRKSDLLEIQKVFGPTSLEAGGKAVFWTVVIKNIGSDEQEDVYVKVSSPELGLLVEERAGDIEATDDDGDEDVATVDIPLRVEDKNAVEGTYTLYVKVYNDDVEITTTRTLQLSGAKAVTASTEVVPVKKSLEVRQGETGIYKLNLLNLGNSAQTYTLQVEGLGGWAIYQINPLSLTLGPQVSQAIDVGLTVSEDALVGEHAFTVKVLSNGKEVRSVALTTEVEKASKGVSGMVISVVVLAVVLVVLLTLLAKLRKSDEEVEESEESYY